MQRKGVRNMMLFFALLSGAAAGVLIALVVIYYHNRELRHEWSSGTAQIMSRSKLKAVRFNESGQIKDYVGREDVVRYAFPSKATIYKSFILDSDLKKGARWPVWINSAGKTRDNSPFIGHGGRTLWAIGAGVFGAAVLGFLALLGTQALFMAIDARDWTRRMWAMRKFRRERTTSTETT